MLKQIRDIHELRKDKGYYREPDGSGAAYCLIRCGKKRASIAKRGGIDFPICNEDLEARPLYEGIKPEVERVSPKLYTGACKKIFF